MHSIWNASVVILGISWHQFVRNEEIATRTGLPPLSTTICCRRSAIFGHLARLGDEAPAHKALYSCLRLSQGRLPDPTWKRRPGRPRGRWIDQLRRYSNRPPADQWKLAIKCGHGGRATLRSQDYVTSWPDLISRVQLMVPLHYIKWPRLHYSRAFRPIGIFSDLASFNMLTC